MALSTALSIDDRELNLLRRMVPNELEHVFTLEAIHKILHDKSVPEIQRAYGYANPEEFRQFLMNTLKAEINDCLRLRDYNVQEGWE